MVVNYINLHNDLFNKIYIYGNATDKDKEMYEKLCEWFGNDETLIEDEVDE